MSLITAKHLRLSVNIASMEDIQDVKTGDVPRIWRGNNIRFELGFFYGDTLSSISDIASITLQVKADRGDAALMEATIAAVDMDNTLTQGTWDDGTKQHAVVEFTGAETNLDLSGDDEKIFWLVIAAVTTAAPGKDITLGAGKFTIEEDGYLTPGTPPTPAEDFWNKTESDARYMLASMAGQNTRWSGGIWHIQNADDPTYWHPVVIRGDTDNPTFDLGPGVTL